MGDQAEKEGRIVLRAGVRIEEIEEESVDAEYGFVGDAIGRRPAPVERQIFGTTYGIHDARRARETRPPVVDEIANGVLAALRPATKDGVVLIDDVVNLDDEILLLFALNWRKGVASRVQAIAYGEVIR